jgi:ferredoxin
MKVSVDPDKCMGHNMCTALEPSLFHINEETGVNEMGEFEVPEEQRQNAIRGVAACPERAISVYDDANAG